MKRKTLDSDVVLCPEIEKTLEVKFKQKSFLGHRELFAIRSKWFRTILCNSEEKLHVVEIPDLPCSLESFQIVIESFYDPKILDAENDNKLSVTNPNLLKDLLFICEYFDVPDLIPVCERKLISVLKQCKEIFTTDALLFMDALLWAQQYNRTKLLSIVLPICSAIWKQSSPNYLFPEVLKKLKNEILVRLFLGSFNIGDFVEVVKSNKWHVAVILAKPSSAAFRVKYVGYEKKIENVGADRVKGLFTFLGLTDVIQVLTK